MRRFRLGELNCSMGTIFNTLWSTCAQSPGSPDVDELGVRASKIRLLDESLRDKKGTIGSGGV